MTTTEEQNETQRQRLQASLRRTFVSCVITAAVFIYVYFGNLQVLLNSHYSAEVGISSLWVSDEARYYLHMMGINAVALGVIVFFWVWRRMTGKRFIVMLLFFNFAALAAGYSTLGGKSFTLTNERMKQVAEELASAARGFPTSNLRRYPISLEELKWLHQSPPSPYFYKGQGRPLKIVVIENATGPFKDLTAGENRAGTIYYAVDREGKHFWVTYLEYDFANKMSVFAKEGSGEVLVLTGSP